MSEILNIDGLEFEKFDFNNLPKRQQINTNFIITNLISFQYAETTSKVVYVKDVQVQYAFIRTSRNYKQRIATMKPIRLKRERFTEINETVF